MLFCPAWFSHRRLVVGPAAPRFVGWPLLSILPERASLIERWGESPLLSTLAAFFLMTHFRVAFRFTQCNRTSFLPSVVGRAWFEVLKNPREWLLLLLRKGCDCWFFLLFRLAHEDFEVGRLLTVSVKLPLKTSFPYNSSFL